MRTPLPARRLVRGMPGMLLATLVLFARLLAPSMAMPGGTDAAGALGLAGLQVICHAGAPAEAAADHDPAAPPNQGDCQLCPACHLASQLALPAPAPGVAAASVRVPLGLAAPPPPATGPPGRPRLAAQPTGPPAPLA